VPNTGWQEKDTRNIREIRAYLERQKLDAFIPWKPAHVAYLTNHYDDLHLNILWEQVLGLLVIPLASDPFAVGNHYIHLGYADDGVAPYWAGERTGRRWPGQRAMRDAVEMMEKRGFGQGRIGLELKWMPYAAVEYLRSLLPEADFVSADRLIPQLRLIKTQREQALMAKACEVGLRAMEAYMQALRLGATRREAELLRAQKALEHGGEWAGGPYQMQWTGGTATTPAWWDDAARRQYQRSLGYRNWLQLPDEAPFFVSHFEARFQYYWADMAWHEFYGPEPDPDERLDLRVAQPTYREAKEDFDVLRRVATECPQVIRPAMDQWQAKEAVDAYLAADDEARRHITGYFVHGIGLEIHEEPVLCSGQESIPLDGPIYFQPGAVVASEWFTKLWTVEEPFVMTASGAWEPLCELKGICDPAAASISGGRIT
jgi:Xaa-Pro aminopeptidase